MIEAEAGILDHHLRQRRRIAYAEIEAEPGNRMDDMRRIPDQRQPLADEALGDEEIERKALQPADDRHRPQPVADPPLQLALLLPRRRGQDRRRRPGAIPSTRSRCDFP